MKSNIVGNVVGLGSGLLWGLDTVLSSLIFISVPFSLGDPRLISGALLVAFFHDFISAIFLSITLMIEGKLPQTLSVLKVKSAHFVMIGSLFAGPLGMRSYLYAVDSIGSGLTATISSIYPAVAAILGALFLKDFLKKRNWLGLLLIILAVVTLGFSSFQNTDISVLGILAGVLCVGGWAAESVITAYGMKEDITPKQALFIRQWTSSIFYFMFMVFEGDVIYSLQSVISSQIFYLILITSIVGTVSYLCYYFAINEIGPVKATALNVTYSIWASIFTLLFLDGTLDVKLVISSLLILVGSYFIMKK